MKYPDMFKLRGKVSVITGGATGLGKSIALGLAEAGSDIAIIDLNSAENTVEDVIKLGRRSFDIQADVTSKGEVLEATKKILKDFGRIDILVNNAGWGSTGLIEEFKESEWDKTMNTNLTSAFLCSQAVGKVMIKQKRGNIINIASVYGIVPSVTDSVPYGVSKAALCSLTKELAVKWAKYNIRVNAIAPTFIKTEMAQSLFDDADFYKNVIAGRTPMKRGGELHEIKGAAIFLASEASSLVTGHVLLLDGGWCCWH